MKSLEITEEMMKRLTEKLARKLMVTEAAIGRELTIGEVMQLICDITESKEDAVRLCSLAVYHDLHMRVKDGEEI